MAEDKVFINPKMISYIKKKRKELSLSAYKLAENCGEGKYWINNIENGRTKTISVESAMKLYNVLDEIEHQNMVNDYLKKVEAGIVEPESLFDENQNDPSHEEGGDQYEFDAIQHKKALKKKINVAHDKMLSLLEKIDYSNPDSINKYEPYILTYTALFTSVFGQELFKRLMKYPLHLLPAPDIDSIVETIETNSPYGYRIAYDRLNRPYIIMKDLHEDS